MRISVVYYSNYGNLSSRVYLPHAKKWLNGETVQGIELKEDQARTLKVLFEYLGLKPDEIIELGKDPEDISRKARNNSTPTAAEIREAETNKEERMMLLNSAGAQLTQKFRNWWRQGEYVFRLSADGDYFTIWVKDDRRDTEIDLADRSTGLQWFLSFFLVFLVEAHGANENAVLLLDEAGLSLHPKAQHDLLMFFEGLSKDNQVIHTTHSPFLIDSDNVDRCVAVYVGENGGTEASNNLRDGSGSLEKNSIYAVHAALGLSVSDVLLSGCYPVIVEGPSDQYVLSAIKQKLISEGLIKPGREMVFLPAGGNKGISAIAGVLGMNDELPPVLLDGDRSGQESAKNLKKSLYKEGQERVLALTDYTTTPEAEIEDLIPFDLVERYVNRLFNEVDEEGFADEYDDAQPIVPQIEKFANKHSVMLQQGQWKVDMAKAFKARLQKGSAVDSSMLKLWADLFEALLKQQ